MSHHFRVSSSRSTTSGAPSQELVPFILQIMDRRQVTLRQLETETGINKSRLGLLLHRNNTRRVTMTIDELQMILHALDCDVVRAFIQSQLWRDLEMALIERHDSLISMLCDAFVGLPKILISNLESLDGFDGSEVRREWAGAVQRTVVGRLMDGVRDILARRAALSKSDDFRW